MTRFYFLLIFMASGMAGLSAQNPMFVPFGQTRNHVMEFLAEKDYVKEQDSLDDNVLTQKVSFRQKED